MPLNSSLTCGCCDKLTPKVPDSVSRNMFHRLRRFTFFISAPGVWTATELSVLQINKLILDLALEVPWARCASCVTEGAEKAGVSRKSLVVLRPQLSFFLLCGGTAHGIRILMYQQKSLKLPEDDAFVWRSSRGPGL